MFRSTVGEFIQFCYPVFENECNCYDFPTYLSYCVASMFRIYCGVSRPSEGGTLPLRKIAPLRSRNIIVDATGDFLS